MVEGSLDIDALVDVVGEAVPDEVLAVVADESLLGVGEVDHAGLEHDAFVQDAHLTHLVAEGLLPEDHLVVDHPQRPHVHLGGNHRLLLGNKALRRQVPVRPHALRSQLQVLLLGCLAQPEVRDLHPPLVEQDVLRLQVVVDYLVRQLVQVANRTHHLTQDQPRLLLGDAFVLLEVVRQVGTIAVLHDGAEGRGVDLDGIVELDDVGVGQHLMDAVLSKGVFHVVLLRTAVPAIVELVQFDRHVA